jgi:basic amino acid/polyamine antiporter, APA family
MMRASMSNLVRTLRLRDIYLLLIGSVIGSGIFLVPATILMQVHLSVALALLVWIVGGVLSLLGALTYGELGAMNPAAGGLYVYIRDAFGPLPAFLYGWALFLVIASGTNAALAVAFSNYLGELVPLSHLGAQLAGLIMLTLLTALNVLGTRKSADVQNWSTLVKMAGIVAMSGVLLACGHNYSATRASMWPAHFDHSLLAGFGLAMIGAMWAYEGWQWVTYSAGEMIDPARDFPRASLAAGLTLIAIYLLPVCAYFVVLGPEQAADSPRIATEAVSAVAGAWAAKLLAVIILISVFSNVNSAILTVPRVFYAMAKDKLFFKQLVNVHPRFHTPAVAIIASGVWSAVLAWTGTFTQLLTYVVFAAWIFYGLAGASLFVFRRRMPAASLPYRVPGYPWTPLLFVLASAALVINTIVSDWKDSAFGVAIILLGLPAYLFWRKRGGAVASTETPLE